MATRRVPQPPLAKHWCFTLNNPTDDEFLDPALTSYMVVGQETGDSGTFHFQGYVCFIKAQRLTSVKKLLPRAHWEISRGTPQEASDYCKKDGNFKETGTLPLNGGATAKRNYDAYLASAKTGDFDNIPSNILIQHYHAFKRIKQDYQQSVPDLDSPCGIWIYGPPGIGKSYDARRQYPGYYDKPINKWWDGYQGQDSVILDDFSPVHVVLGHHLKRWADQYSFPAEQKGTTIQIRPKHIIVTSNYSINAIFHEDPILCEALERRFKEIHFNH